MSSVFSAISKNRVVLLYGACLAVLLFLLKWLELRLLILHHSLEIYIGAIALLFTLLGIWLALKLTRPRVRTIEVERLVYRSPELPFIFNEEEANRLALSKRELEVLQLMAEGCSNQEIALRLFVSLNTVKTHSSRVFEKLDVKRRTQAIEKAKRLSLIP